MTSEERRELDAKVGREVVGREPEIIYVASNDGGQSCAAFTDRGGPWHTEGELRDWLDRAHGVQALLDYEVVALEYWPRYSSDPTAASRVLDVLAGADVLWTIDNDEPGTAHVTLILPESADFFTVDGRAPGKPSEAWPEALSLACTTDPVLSHMAEWRANREETKAHAE